MTQDETMRVLGLMADGGIENKVNRLNKNNFLL